MLMLCPVGREMIFEDSASLHILCEDGSKLGRVQSSNLRSYNSVTPSPLFKLAKSQFPAVATKPKPMINSFDFELTVMFPSPPAFLKTPFCRTLRPPHRAGIFLCQ
ncbi:hypothetical protein CEXT_538741 [Caerostris extrusa]|uniref:Uncharacterized protein n=1 Tax=Caerostris extrusa TaxID=172846 RepID=A0AAV4QQ83_CAEEX|nr:hypothetical protein CEXT_538741 [Caerostris extrusa]